MRLRELVVPLLAAVLITLLAVGAARFTEHANNQPEPCRTETR